jgi:hypothetical protein
VLSALRLLQNLEIHKRPKSRWNPLNYIPETSSRRTRSRQKEDDVFGILDILENSPVPLNQRTIDKILLGCKHLRHVAILLSHFFLIRRYQTMGMPGTLILLGLGGASYLATFP